MLPTPNIAQFPCNWGIISEHDRLGKWVGTSRARVLVCVSVGVCVCVCLRVFACAFVRAYVRECMSVCVRLFVLFAFAKFVPWGGAGLWGVSGNAGGASCFFAQIPPYFCAFPGRGRGGASLAPPLPRSVHVLVRGNGTPPTSPLCIFGPGGEGKLGTGSSGRSKTHKELWNDPVHPKHTSRTLCIRKTPSLCSVENAGMFNEIIQDIFEAEY